MKFTIPGKPMGKERPRAVVVNGKVHVYTPPKTAAYQAKTRRCWRDAGVPGFGPDASVTVEITAYHPIPKSVSQRTRKAMEAGKIRPRRKPDVDNVGKIVLDSLNGLAYADDKQVVCLTVCKRYGAPRVVVELLEVTADDHQ